MAKLILYTSLSLVCISNRNQRCDYFPFCTKRGAFIHEHRSDRSRPLTRTFKKRKKECTLYEHLKKILMTLIASIITFSKKKKNWKKKCYPRPSTSCPRPRHGTLDKEIDSYECPKVVVPNDFQDNVNDLRVGVNESIFFSFVCRMTQMNAQKCY